MYQIKYIARFGPTSIITSYCTYHEEKNHSFVYQSRSVPRDCVSFVVELRLRFVSDRGSIWSNLHANKATLFIKPRGPIKGFITHAAPHWFALILKQRNVVTSILLY